MRHPKKWPFFAQKWPKIANLGQKGSVFRPGCSVLDPPTLFVWCLTQKKILCCMVLKPGNGCFKASPTKKWAFSAQKWPKNANIEPKTLFFGLGRSVEGTPTLFCRCLIKRKTSVAWDGTQKIDVSGPPQRKNGHFLAKNGVNFANFGQKYSVFGLGCSVQDPHTLFVRCLTQRTMHCMVLKSENGCFRATPPKTWPFFPQQWPQNANIGPKTQIFWA